MTLQHIDLRWEFDQSESLDAMGFSFDDAEDLNNLGSSFDGLIEGHGIHPTATRRPDPSIISGGVIRMRRCAMMTVVCVPLLHLLSCTHVAGVECRLAHTSRRQFRKRTLWTQLPWVYRYSRLEWNQHLRHH